MKSVYLIALAALSACHVVAPGKAKGVHLLDQTLVIRVESPKNGHVQVRNRGEAELTVLLEGRTSSLAAGATFLHRFGPEFGSLIIANKSGKPILVEYEVYAEATSPHISVVGH